jgi:hypothetical protein
MEIFKKLPIAATIANIWIMITPAFGTAWKLRKNYKTYIRKPSKITIFLILIIFRNLKLLGRAASIKQSVRNTLWFIIVVFLG